MNFPKKNQQNLKFFQKSEEEKNPLFFKTSEIFTIFLFCQKNALLLVLPIEEISLRPELSSPSCFRIQGGYRERHTQKNGRTEILVSNFRLGKQLQPLNKKKSQMGTKIYEMLFNYKKLNKLFISIHYNWYNFYVI